MTRGTQLIQELILQGIRLWPHDGKMRYAGLPHRLTPTVKELLRQSREELLDLLTGVHTVPLSYGQQGLWSIHQQAPDNSAYTVSSALELSGSLNLALLRDVIQLLINRHAALRTRFVWQDEQVVQQVDGYQHAVIEEVVAHGWSESARAQVLRELHERPFDLEQGPLFRTTILQHDSDTHTLLLSVHHIVIDGWSIYQLLDELVTFYRALHAGQPVPLPLIEQSYTDYIAWQRELIQREEPRLWAFWQQQLQGELPVLQLPTDFPRPPVRSLRGMSHPIVIAPPLTARLKALARQQSTTLFTLLLAAYQLLLHRHTGQEVILASLPTHGRSNERFDEVVGYLVSPVVIRTTFKPMMTFAELLSQVKVETLAAMDHQDYPFARLVERLNPPRDPSRTPITQSSFLLKQSQRGQELLQDAGGVSIAGLQPRVLELPLHAGQEDIALDLRENSAGITGNFKASADLFTPATLERIAARFICLLETLVCDDQTVQQRPIAHLSIIPDAERELMASWNDTVVDYPQTCVHTLFEAQVARTPDAVALIFEEQQVRYAELNARANQVAHQLRSLGVGPEVLVGICVERSVEMVVGLLGILKAGGAYVPLDPSYPAERLAFMLEDAAVPVLLTQAHLRETLPVTGAQLLCLDADWPTMAQQPITNLISGVQPEQLAYVIYTSGSTGRPKGVMITHQNLHNAYQGWAQRYELETCRAHLQMASIAFDVFAGDLVRALGSGAKLVLCPRSWLLDAERLYRLIRTEGVDSAEFVPVVMRNLVEYLEQTGQDLQGMRLVVVGSDHWYRSEHERVRRLCGSETRVINSYGVTEATIDSSCFGEVGLSVGAQQSTTVGEQEHHVPLTDGALVPIGRPFANVQVYLVDRLGALLPIGVAGELWIGGAGVARGYLNRPELTAERFITNPFGPGRLYRTGDLARWLPDGNLEYLGRIDQQVKIRGFRIELGEIESVLATHPAVQSCVVVAREDTPGEKRLVAYLVGEATPEELRAHLQSRLPDYMLPSAFVSLDALPLTPNGKVDRKALPVPDFVPLAPRDDSDPRTPAEATIATIWQQLLRLPQVGLDDNFFTVGGDSILSIQLVSRARQAGLHLTPRQVFEYQTIRQLAAVATPALLPMVDQGAVLGDLPLTSIQHWFLEQAWTEAHHFNQAVLLAVAPDTNLLHLQEALTTLLTHHDALRLRFTQVDGTWQQAHAPVGERAVLTVVDLALLPPEQRHLRFVAEANQIQASLNLVDGPLLRACFFSFGPQESGRLLLVIHHLVVDGVSWRVLLEDLEQAYTQVHRGESVLLPAKTTAFRDWSHWLATTGVERLRGERTYWEQVVSRCDVALPVDFPAALHVNTMGSVAEVTVVLDAATTTALLQQAPVAYRTQVNDLLLAALVRTVSRWSGQRRVVLELEGHGREVLDDEDVSSTLDLSRTVGWFTSLFPVVLEVASDDDADLICTVKEQLRAIPNRGVGYGVLRYLDCAEGLVPETPIGLSFNYLGQLDTVDTSEAGLLLRGMPQEESGQTSSATGQRSNLIEINAMVVGGELQVSWSYSRTIHQPQTISQVAETYLATLRHLVTHCTTTAGGFTPSDFSAVGLVQAELDGWFAQDGHRIEDAYELTPMQEGMLFESLYAPGSGVYVTQLCFRLEPTLDVAAFREAWQGLMDRHAILRTRFHWEREGAPLQLVLRQVTLPWEEVTLDGAMRLEAWLAADRERGFRLDTAPLMRVSLLRSGDGQVHAVWTSHHLIGDGWSLPILFQELMERYEAVRGAYTLALPTPRPYRDYIRWLRRQDRAAAAAFWREQLAPFTAPTPLGVDRPATIRGTESSRYVTREHRLPPALTRALSQVAQEVRVTLNTLVQGAWALLLSRYSGEEAVLFGATISGRQAALPGVEQMVGLFINTLPVAVRVAPHAVVAEWLQEVQRTQAAAQEHGYLGLPQIQQGRGIPQGTALFESILVFENYPVEAGQQAGGVALVSDVAGYEQTNYALTVAIIPPGIGEGSGLGVSISYDERRVADAAITRMAGHLEMLLQGMVANPLQSVAELPLLTEVERQQLLVDWNDTAVDYPQACIHELFEAQVARTPEAIALVFEEQQVSYAELNARANQVAHQLQRLGVGLEVLVGICVERSIEMVVGILGILKAGGAYVPLDPSYPAERLAFMLEDAAVPVLLTQAHLRETLPATDARLLCLDADWPTIVQQPTTNPVSGVHPEHLAYVIYTSGSTGRPKGVLNQHAGVTNLLSYLQSTHPLTAADRTLQTTNFSFDVATAELLWPLLNGARLILTRPDGQRDSRYLVTMLLQHAITTLHIVPTLLQLLVDEPEFFQATTLHRILAAGEALPAALQQRLQAHPTARLENWYGPTETAIYVTTWAGSTASRSGIVPIGRPVANTQAYVLNNWLQPVPIGVAGELHIGGVQVGRGYLKRPELTAERFITNPFGPGRLYRTGDLVRWLPDGNLEYLGRIDQQVKIRGFRIELGEIESVLATHPAVQTCIVIAREDTPGEKRLVAYLVGEATPDELRAHLQSRLPDYMLPSAFVTLEALPLTPNGKVDRKALPAPDMSALLQPGDVAPRTRTEVALAAIWQTVLGLSQVGVGANFFALGGHSLLATRVVSRIRQEVGVELPLRTLFEQPTIAGLATQVDTLLQSHGMTATRPIPRADRSQPLPLSYGQERLWFLDQFDADHTAYSMPGAVRLRGALDLAALERSLQEIVRRHEVLRTAFVVQDGIPRQQIAPATFRLPVVDLSSLEPAAREVEAEQLVEAELAHAFDLSTGPLFRASLLCLQPGSEYVLLLNMHHTVSDAWSLDLLQRELTLLYTAFTQGQPSPLPELALQYADIAAWQRQWLAEGVLEAQLAWWQTHLVGAPELLTLPTDRPRPPAQTFRGATHTFTLPQELMVGLQGLNQQYGVTSFMTLLAAFNVLLMRSSNQHDIVVGAPVAGRNRLEFEPLIGLFVNTLALRSQLTHADGTPLPFTDLLTQVRQTVLEAQRHQDVPFEQLVERLQPVRALSHTPLFQVMFNLLQETAIPFALPGVQVEMVEADYAIAKFDLTLTVVEGSGVTTAALEYNTDLFDQTTIERMAGHFVTLLAGMVANPTQSVADLPLLTETERQQLLVDWNDTAADYPQACIHALFEAQVARTPDAVALVFEGQHLTYAELNARANQVAHQLQLLGVGPEVLIGICVERSLEMVVGLLGILKAGGAYVPLDPSYPQERLAFMLQDAAVPVLLTQAHLRDRLPTTDARLLCLDTDWPTIAQQPTTLPVRSVQPNHLAYVIYTSGSTGQPKGVLVTHRNVVRLTHQTNYAHFGADERWLQLAPISFDASTLEIWGALLHGALLVVMPPQQPSLEALGTALRDYGITSLWLTAGLFHLMVDERLEDLRLLRQLFAGGDVLSVPHVRRVVEQLPTCRLINGYGPTENTTFTCCFPMRGSPPMGTSVPIGRPIGHTQVYLLDAAGQPVPIGIAGELYAGGAGVARGYLKRPELTAERFIANPFGPGRLYRTGDLARWLPDGTIEFLGRTDQQVKIRGFRIELGEIESVLATHPAVQTCVVVAREDTPGEKRLVAYLVGEATPDELRAHLQHHLPDYMLPTAFVTLDALPLTPNGKVDRKALPEPRVSHLKNTLLHVPLDGVEQQLAAIWMETLRLSFVSVYDNFFTLGGHSLLAVRLMAAVQQRFNCHLPLSTLFTHPTIVDLAQVIRQNSAVSGWSSLVPIQPHGNRPPLFCVHPIGGNVFTFYGLAQYLGPDQPIYGLQSVGLDGVTTPDQTIRAMAERYAAQIRTVQPTGPYWLMGYSFGGTVAYAVAQSLRQTGAQVARVIIIDTPATNTTPEVDRLHWSDTQWLLEATEGLGQASARMNQLIQTLRQDRDWLALPFMTQLSQLNQHLRQALPDEWFADDTTFYVLIQVYRANRQAGTNYESDYPPEERLPVPVTLLRAHPSGSDMAAHADATWGWADYADGPVDLRWVASDHKSMFLEPHIQEVAAQLAAALANGGS